MRRRLKSGPASVTTATMSTFAPITCACELLPGICAGKTRLARQHRADHVVLVFIAQFEGHPVADRRQVRVAGGLVPDAAAAHHVDFSPSPRNAPKLIGVSRIRRAGTQPLAIRREGFFETGIPAEVLEGHPPGILHVLHALMHVRTSQGTIAWVISLVTVPFLAIPLYWLLGRTRFAGHVGGRGKRTSAGRTGHLDARAAARAGGGHPRGRRLRARGAHARRPALHPRQQARTADRRRGRPSSGSSRSSPGAELSVREFFHREERHARHPLPAGAHRAGAGRSEGVFPV
jgi:hypothetical protein